MQLPLVTQEYQVCFLCCGEAVSSYANNLESSRTNSILSDSVIIARLHSLPQRLDVVLSSVDKRCDSNIMNVRSSSDDMV